MRVIAGIARSMPLKAPAGLDTRPTSDRIKETLFNILQNQIPGAVVLDLFAGSGALGIESLSRGAKLAFFVDSAPAACQCIEANLRFTKMDGRARIFRQDAGAAVYSLPPEHIDIVFLDPPYGQGLERRALEALAGSNAIDGESILVIEAGIKDDLSYVESLGYTVYREKLYKKSKHLFLRKA